LDAYPAVGAESRVTKEVMAEAGAEEVTKHVSSNLGHVLSRFIVENIIMDRPGVLSIEYDHYNDTTRFRAQIHVLSSAEIRSLLNKAFQAGRSFQAEQG
jgi:hypothetical protein